MNKKFTPIILAAGIGRRLYPFTKETPKGLIEVNGVSIIDNIFHALEKHSDNIDCIVIVVGYLKEKISNRFGMEWNGIPIKYVENEIYDSTNNIYSLAIASHHADTDVVLFECDVFFDHAILNTLLEAADKYPESLAVVEKLKSWMDGTVVTIEDGFITKLLNSSDTKGKETYKTLNIYYFKRKFFKEVYIPMLEVYMKTHSDNHYYEVVLSAIVHLKHFKIRALVNRGEKWFEIDDYNDLQRAKTLFLSPSDELEQIKKSWGGYWNHDIIDFNMICNSYYPDDKFVDIYKENIAKLIKSYPSTRKLINRKLAAVINANENEIVTSNGASEIIRALKGIISKPLHIFPAFEEYYNSIPGDIFYLKTNENFHLNFSDLISHLNAGDYDSLILINPNNPTSQHVQMKDIYEFISGISLEIIVFLDLSFFDFVTDDFEFDHTKFQNVVVIKSLGKSFGIPGLRLGYLQTSNQQILNQIDQKLPIWNINSFAEYFLDNFFKLKGNILDSFSKIKNEKEWLTQELEKIEIFGTNLFSVIGNDANFLFCQVDSSISIDDLSLYLFKRSKIIIKDCTSKIRDSEYNYLRLNIQTRENNILFLNTTKQYLQERYKEISAKESKSKNRWREIWQKKSIDDDRNITLSDLLSADGFDTGFGNIDESSWSSYIKYCQDKLGITSSDTIFEIGCGCGAFLYPFYKDGLKVSGIDFSENLIKTAKMIMPEAQFEVKDAQKISPNPNFDYIVANSVFFYFPDYGFAKKVFSMMIKKARKGIAILDVPDKNKEKACIEMRKKQYGEDEYNKRYEGLEHLFFKKQWFLENLIEDDVSVVIENQQIRNYDNNKYRYNVFIKFHKKD